jgi:uncharacterized membrane protein YhaH (DUF805 family)
MSVNDLFLGFQGRISRMQFWIGTVIVAALELALRWMLGVPLAGGTPDPRLRTIAFVIGLIFVYPTAAIAVKRLHDRNQPAAYVWLLMAAFAVILVGDLFGYFDDPDRLSLVGGIAMAVVAVIALAFLVELGFRRGTPGPSRYGPDPLEGRG